MTQGPPPSHSRPSADAARRWDGRAWVADSAPERSVAATAPPIRPPGTYDHPPVDPPADAPTAGHGPPEGRAGSPAREGAQKGESETRYGWPMVGALIGASLVVLAAIIGAAMLAYRAAGSPPPNPVATPSARAVDPNSLNYRYLAGVTVGGLRGTLEGEGFSCSEPAPAEDHLRDWRCDRTRGTQHDIVQIWAVDGGHVHLVDVTTVAKSGPLDDQGAVALNARVAQLVYPGSPADASAAISWVNANPGDATTSVGGLTLRRTRSDVATLLEFDAGTRR